MDTLPSDIQDTIYKYKHQLEYKDVMDDMEGIYCLGCFNHGDNGQFLRSAGVWCQKEFWFGQGETWRYLGGGIQ